MHSAYISYRSSSIHYNRIGNGGRVVICFHGYGEEASAYTFLEKHVQAFSLFAIDLPYHGKTNWKEGYTFTVADLDKIIGQILNQNPDFAKQKITLLGFSLGCRMALSLYQSQADKIGKLVLLAPDGLKLNFWYWLATQTWLGNKFFLLTMKKPGWFLGFLRLLNKLKLVNSSIFKFVTHYIGDQQVREQLYTRWTTLRKLKPNLSHVRSLIRSHKTPVRLVYGKHDRIILASVGERFKNGIEDYCSLTIINSGHQVLQEKHAEEIMNALLH
jgi:pimeloyl-ACP methyl ester carboxylesterase